MFNFDIDGTIEELKNNDLSLEDVTYLASLYILKKEAHLDTSYEVKEEWSSLITEYVMSREVKDLNCLLGKIGDVISELYHTAESEKERLEFEEFIKRITSILTPTIV